MKWIVSFLLIVAVVMSLISKAVVPSAQARPTPGPPVLPTPAPSASPTSGF